MSKLSVYDGVDWVEITGKDGVMGMVDTATVGYLEEEIKKVEKKIPLMPQGRVGWGAHPLRIENDGVVIEKVARSINFVGGSVSRDADGRLNVPVGGTDGVLATITGVDFASTGTTNLYTVPVGKVAIITGLIIRPTAADQVVVPARAGVGIAAGEDDIMPSTVLTGLDSVGEVFQWHPNGITVTGAATNVIKIGVDVGAIS